MALAMCLLVFVAAAAPEEAVFKEHQVKAAFVFNFVKFVEWPTNAFADESAPIQIGVAGNATMVAALDAAIKGKEVGGRELAVRRVETPEQASEVNVLFLGADVDAGLTTWLAAASKTNVLTIGESEVFRKSDGMIAFVWQGDRLRFEINVAEADRAKLRVSAQLLKLASKVRKRP
jgi:hypothetical protein